MKFTIKTMVLLLVALGINNNLSAQLKLPAPSSTQTIIQEFGLGKITLTYARPSVKGRKIFGGMEPMDKVWRTGANAATIITFTDAVKIEGQDLPAGEYGLFSIPNAKEWTVIFSKTAKQWGAYTYDQKDDVLRVKVKTNALKDKVETLTMQFANVTESKAQLQLTWENMSFAVNLTTDVDAKAMANIAEAMKGEKKPYMQSAIYYFTNGKDLKTALGWMVEADKAEPKMPWTKLWLGKMQLKSGDKVGAAESAKAGIALATTMKNDEYIRLNTQLLAETKK
ncbi:DUF2911 domain-containing protein [Pedobacter frigiditerrae]|uniref:DUF2911 domain-containing protein n=1 Tax=Pedobacter frigiditerrae TaxID=2530452 RepID=A0A4R0N4L5_9SPHI|nr:DUF2911 domain-containing protein [Pedobacter frigiditerrae]TCC93482.1 DUF2911 domain-containing protein [Pedobacter frigiditerrae]